MPGKLGEDSRFDPVFWIGAAIEVLRVQRFAARMRDKVVVEALKIFRADLAVAAPPDRVFGQRVDDGVLVLRRTAGVGTRLRAQRPALDDRGFVRGDRVLIEYRRGVIPMDGFEVLEAKSVGAVSAVPQTRFLHERPPRRSRLPPDPLPVAYRVTVDDSARRPIPRPINGSRLVSMLRRSSTHSFRQSLADEPFLDETDDLIAVPIHHHHVGVALDAPVRQVDNIDAAARGFENRGVINAALPYLRPPRMVFGIVAVNDKDRRRLDRFDLIAVTTERRLHRHQRLDLVGPRLEHFVAERS